MRSKLHSGRIIYFDVKIRIYFHKIKKVCIVLLSMVMLSQKCYNGLGLHLGVFWSLFGTLFLILEQKDPRMQLLAYSTFLGPYDLAKRNTQWDSQDFSTMEFCTFLFTILLEKLLSKMCQTAALQKLP